MQKTHWWSRLWHWWFDVPTDMNVFYNHISKMTIINIVLCFTSLCIIAYKLKGLWR